MNRNDRLKIKYQALRDAGFNSAEATKYKNYSWQKIQHLAKEKMELDKHISKLKNEMQERIQVGW